MEIGLKYYPKTLRGIISDPGFETILGMADFIELTAVTGEDFSGFEGFPKPITVHCMHSCHGFWFNPASPEKRKRNMELIEFSIKVADQLDSEIIVVHPGVREEGSSLEEAGRFLAGFRDSRIRLETLPFDFRGTEFFGRSPDEMKKLVEMTGFGICLDLAHASESSIIHGKGKMGFIRDFLKMGPDYFHISDTRIEGKSVEGFHQHLGKGNLDMEAIREIIPSSARVCLETPLDLEGRIEDIRFLRGEK